MSTSSPNRARPRRGAGLSASPRRYAASTLVAAVTFVLLAGASAAPAAAAPTTRSAAAAAPVFDADYLDGVSGARPAQEVDLAGTWDFTPLTDTVCTGGGRFGTTTGPFLSCVDSPAGDGPTTIQVPGGGWVKQGWTNLSRATYAKTITVPMLSADQVTRLNFGAINHRATVTVDGREAGTQTTSYTNSVFDLSDFVTPGAEHRIEVTVEGRKALVGPDLRYTVPEGASWSDDVAQGIFRSVNLEVFPAVFVADTFVQTSVADKTLSYDVKVTNSTDREQKVDVDGALSSWNGQGWKYPAVPTEHAVVPANTTAAITVGPLRWRADEGSYWTPNVPYQADYTAQLHELGVSITSRPVGGGEGSGGPKSTSEYGVRFGFRELKQVGDHFELNGVKVNFRGDSIQGANYDNIDHHGVSDAFDTLPGFLEPSEGNGGWPQAVRNYQRLNYNLVRIHQVPATPYMLDVADELGLMIQGETAIRGSNNRQNFDTGRDNMVEHLADLVLRDRNHASVVRWSQANEPQMPFFVNPGQGAEFDELLYQTVMALDTTRPISTDGDSPDLPHDNYTVFCHYEGDSGQFAIAQYTENVCDVPGKPNGQGEFIWYNDNTAQGMTWFATASLRMREKGAEDTRPYTLLSNWSSVIPGVERTDFSSLEIGYPAGPLPLFGEDNLPDPWGNPRIQLLQKAFNPVAAVDTAFWDQNKLSNAAGEWPVAPTVIAAGANTRILTLFNDTFTGTRLGVSWSLRQGAPDGAVVASGSLTPDIAPGEHAQRPISFTAPATTDLLYLDIRVEKPGQGVLFQDASTVYQVQ